MKIRSIASYYLAIRNSLKRRRKATFFSRWFLLKVKESFSYGTTSFFFARLHTCNVWFIMLTRPETMRDAIWTFLQKVFLLYIHYDNYWNYTLLYYHVLCMQHSPNVKWNLYYVWHSYKLMRFLHIVVSFPSDSRDSSHVELIWIIVIAVCIIRNNNGKFYKISVNKKIFI